MLLRRKSKLEKRWARRADKITDMCWKNVSQNKGSGRWSHCVLEEGHKGDCEDHYGNTRNNA